MNYIERAILEKQRAADVLMPLIEFEACFLGDESVKLVQGRQNQSQLEQIYRIAKAHNWATPKGVTQYRTGSFAFSLSKAGFKEIYSLGGPMSDKRKDEWARLLVERAGIKGGCQKGKPSTKWRVVSALNGHPGASVEELCLHLRLQPGVVREALRGL